VVQIEPGPDADLTASAPARQRVDGLGRGDVAGDHLDVEGPCIA
jgi:hypothetical protein